MSKSLFIVTYLATAGLWLPILRGDRSPTLPGRGPLLLLLLLASVMPSGVALLLATIEDGKRGVAELLSQVARWRFGLGWYAFALLLAPALALVTFILGQLLGVRSVRMLDFLFPLAAIGEELGWRGYALPRLQPALGPVLASLLIGIVWAAWHLPYFAYPAVHPLPFGVGFPVFAVVLISESVLATWLYNSTGGSVLATMLFHHSIHVATIVPALTGLSGGAVMAAVNGVAALVAVVVSRGALSDLGDRHLSGATIPHHGP